MSVSIDATLWRFHVVYMRAQNLLSSHQFPDSLMVVPLDSLLSLIWSLKGQKDRLTSCCEDIWNPKFSSVNWSSRGCRQVPSSPKQASSLLYSSLWLTLNDRRSLNACRPFSPAYIVIDGVRLYLNMHAKYTLRSYSYILSASCCLLCLLADASDSVHSSYTLRPAISWSTSQK